MRVVVDNIVKDTYVVNVVGGDAAKGLVVDRIVLNRDVVRNYAPPGVSTLMPTVLSSASPVL